MHGKPQDVFDQLLPRPLPRWKCARRGGCKLTITCVSRTPLRRRPQENGARCFVRPLPFPLTPSRERAACSARAPASPATSLKVPRAECRLCRAAAEQRLMQRIQLGERHKTEWPGQRIQAGSNRAGSRAALETSTRPSWEAASENNPHRCLGSAGRLTRWATHASFDWAALPQRAARQTSSDAVRVRWRASQGAFAKLQQNAYASALKRRSPWTRHCAWRLRRARGPTRARRSTQRQRVKLQTYKRPNRTPPSEERSQADLSCRLQRPKDRLHRGLHVDGILLRTRAPIIAFSAATKTSSCDPLESWRHGCAASPVQRWGQGQKAITRLLYMLQCRLCNRCCEVRRTRKLQGARGTCAC